MRVAIFLPNWIGDVVMATPTLRALRRHFGKSAKLIGIMKPYVVPVLEGTPWLDETWLYERNTAEPVITCIRLIRRMYEYRFDVAVLLVNTFQAALIAWLARAGDRVGYARYRRGPLLTVKLYPPASNGILIPYPTLDYYLALAYALGCQKDGPRMELGTTEEDERAAEQVWRELGLFTGRSVVAINSSGAFGGSKLWPDEYFADLARRIVTRLNHQVLILCGPSERDRAARIASMAALSGVATLAEQPLSIGLTKACVRRCRLLVTTDSGPRHFAGAFDVPAITLFGPTHIAWSDTHCRKEVHLQIPVECGPCQQRTCPLGHHNCMRNLSVERVFEAVCDALEDKGEDDCRLTCLRNQ
jgi:heptosyltransferase-2